MEHSLEKLDCCPICESSRLASDLTCTDHTYSQDEFRLDTCQDCSFLFTNPRPTESSIGKYYDNPAYVSHNDANQGLLFRLYKFVKTIALKQKRRLLEHHSQGRTALDYGAGTGDFAAVLVNSGWTVSAFEPDSHARARISGKHEKIQLINGIGDLANASQSAITLWHVLEHVHLLKDTITEFNRILQPDGTLVIAVPNHTSYDAGFYGRQWAAYDVPRHLYHFNPDTLTRLLTNHGFSLREIRPMWFDSYYVSLLSETNIRGSARIDGLLGWIRAFFIGTLSNLLTLGSTKRCSSIIYVFKK